MTTYVCYHYPCPDGVFAALAAHAALSSGPAPVRFVPLTVYQPKEERLAMVDTTFVHADTVYLLDFSGGPEFVVKLCSVARAVHLLDHHKTALEDIDALKAAGSLPGNLHMTPDMARSGASIARDAFALHEAGRASASTLRVIDYIEDNDLWKHALPHSKPFSAGFADLGLEMDVNKNGDLWATLQALDADALIARGAAVVERNNATIAAEVATAFVVTLPHYATPVRCLAVVTAAPDLRSAMGNALALLSAERGLAPAGVIVYVEEGQGAASADTFKVSVRSTGDFDTTTLTRALGGGGHKNASSCIIPRATFNSWREAAAPTA